MLTSSTACLSDYLRQIQPILKEPIQLDQISDLLQLHIEVYHLEYSEVSNRSWQHPLHQIQVWYGNLLGYVDSIIHGHSSFLAVHSSDSLHNVPEQREA